MSPDYNDFLQYARDHTKEIDYDVKSKMGSAWNEGITLSQSDVALITQISMNVNYALLRQYHDWLLEQGSR